MYWQVLLWLALAGTSLFILPNCLDRTLAPRFMFLSAVLLAGLLLLWKDLRENADWRLHGFDLLMLAWYGLHLASISWAFSWSEAVFYTQKVLLFFLVYWLVRQAFVRDETLARQTLRQAVTLLTFAVCGILAAQLSMAVAQHGLDNDKLYERDWFLFGNKSLATDLLYFLLIFNVLFVHDEKIMPTDPAGILPSTERKSVGKGVLKYIPIALLLILILLLQTRTVYLAVFVAAVVYFPARAWAEPEFSGVFKKKILPVVVIAFALFGGFLAYKGADNSLSERLNPLTYLESATANERRFVWYKTGLLNADHFWLGVGSGSWKFWFPSKSIEGGYRLQSKNVVFTRAHNDYLEVQSELGIFGVVLFCTLFGMALLASIGKMRRRETEPRARHDLLVLAVGVLGYCVIQYFDFPRERIDLQAILAIMLAMTVYYTREWWARLPGVIMGRYQGGFLTLAAAGLLFNLVIGWHRIEGEIHNVRMIKEQMKGAYARVIEEARAAENRYYEYNDVAVPLAWYEGIAFYQMNQADKSVAAFERSYRLNPWSFQVINNYASALVKSQRYRDAIPLYEKVIQINPRYEDGKFNLAYTWYQAGDFSNALEWLSRVDTIKHPATEEERRKNAAILQRKEEFRKAIGSAQAR